MIRKHLEHKHINLLHTGFRFALVGLATVGVYFAVLALLQPVIPQIVILSATAYIVSALFNYILQARVTFGAHFSDTGTVARYITLHMICLTVNSSFMFLFVAVFGINIFLAQCFVTGIVACTSFTLSYLWVYKRRA